MQISEKFIQNHLLRLVKRLKKNKLTTIHAVLVKAETFPSLIPDEARMKAGDLHFLGWHVQGKKLEV
jgi:hypothetical protein